RMLVLDRTRLTLWMVPGRRLRALHEATMRRNEPLPVSINIGAPPAVMIASAVNGRFLPDGVTKLDVAGALAGEPIALAPALSQPTLVLAESEIVLEGFLDTTVADECVSGTVGCSLPEFLGYDGAARTGLPVVTVTAMTMRRSAVYQAVIGPGREQSVILGLAGALSVALSGDDEDWRMIRDLHFSPAGGGMLLLVVAVCKDSPEADLRLPGIARRLFSEHPFIKVIVFTDEDIEVTSTEDVFWAMTTRANLGTDCTTLPDFSPLGMDPSQSEDWAAARGSDGARGRTFIDATVPYRLRDQVVRSYPATFEEC
ncbi:MAG: UbiD family decarboxylase domain-containing protein, partial [Pseudonocardiaceae bacterium]